MTGGRGSRDAARATASQAGLAALLALSVLAGAAGVGCAVVPQNRRKHLADPMMSLEGDPLEAPKRQKLYSTREAAAGGDGAPAGGGCGCQ